MLETTTTGRPETAPAGGGGDAREEARWRAVVRRDARAAGRFVYAVLTTGIYCRPGCPSRLPARRNVSFHDTPAAAERAGYRACRKCGGAPGGAEARARTAVRRAIRAIEAAADRAPTLDELARGSGYAPRGLHRVFRARTGVTPRRYWDALRLSRLRASLKAGEPVAPALYGAGYGAPSRLYEASGARLGMTPASYGKGGAGARIAWAVRDCPLGRLLVGATGRGVCFVALGDGEAELARELAEDFPRAELVRDEAGLGGALEAVLGLLDGRAPDPALPLDVRATAFQELVWRALTEIPPGETRSYAAIADAIGRPGAARAVGRACGSNPVSLVVPCHRAVGADGRLTGYRWGVERKRALLAREAAGR